MAVIWRQWQPERLIRDVGDRVSQPAAKEYTELLVDYATAIAPVVTGWYRDHIKALPPTEGRNGWRAEAEAGADYSMQVEWRHHVMLRAMQYANRMTDRILSRRRI